MSELSKHFIWSYLLVLYYKIDCYYFEGSSAKNVDLRKI